MDKGTQEEQAAGQTTDQAGQAAQGVQDTAGHAVGQGIEDYSTSDSDTTTVENDKSPKGPLAELLNLEILPSPENETTTLESGDSEDYYGSAGGEQE